MKNIKRIVAIICIVILVGLYLAAFVLSIVDTSASMNLFKGCIACTIFVPLVAYCYICLHKYAMNRSGRKNYYDDNSDTDTKKEA